MLYDILQKFPVNKVILKKRNENKKIVHIRLGILILCNLVTALTLYFSYQYDNIFAIFIYLIFGIISLFQFWKIINTKNVFAIGLSLLSFLIILPIFGIFEYKNNKKSFLKANMHGVYIDLKTDNTYIIKSGSWASKTHNYGRFYFNPKDSIIIFDKRINDGTINSNKMKITKFKNYIKNDNNYHKYLIQLDRNNKEIENIDNLNWRYYRFEVE